MIIISACLLGINCRYDGNNCYDGNVLSKINHCKNLMIPVCPEQLGGLPTPRLPAHITDYDGYAVLEKKEKVINSNRGDVTDCFLRGAYEVLKIVKIFNIHTAILKENSPSCGVHCIKRNDQLIQGKGVTSALLEKNGLRIISSDAIDTCTIL